MPRNFWSAGLRRSRGWHPSWRSGHLPGTRGGYFLAFVDARTGKPVGRWSPGPGFDHADPTWDRTGVYIPTDG
jgi:hypothetical protein